MESNNIYDHDSASEEIIIKQELEIIEENTIQIKIETEDITNNESPDNPFDNLQIEVKNEEVNPGKEDFRTIELALRNDIERQINNSKIISNVSEQFVDVIVKNEVAESILPNDGEVAVKEEEESNLVEYDYPSFDDSMDSSEAAALCHVEACLSDDVQVKTETDNKHYPNIKNESEYAVTETHLISKKLINTTSTLTNTVEGVIQSNTTNTFVMEIHPMSQDNNFNKIANPEEILPTSDNTYKMDCGEMFQLNSITGNVLSLEQEAYGLLKSKRKVTEGYTQKCPKCTKWFRNKYLVKKHLRVHDTIENRAMGVIKGLKTRIQNQLKKQQEVDEDEKLCLSSKEGIDAKSDNQDNYKCTCGKAFRRRSRMETCLRSHTLYSDTCQYECLTCQKKFKSKEMLLFHRNRFHRKRFPCKFCPTDYNSQKELFKHLQVHQKVQLMEYKVIAEVAKGNQELKCLICLKTSQTLADLKSHIMEDHTAPYNCPYCTNEVFAKIMDFTEHMKKAHSDIADQSVLDVLEAFTKLVKAWKCEECGQQFHEADKLALHQIEQHAPDMKNEQHFQCEDCQRVFISNQGLNSHRRMHHRVEPTEPTEPEDIGVMCLACRKMCKDMTALTSHMRLHSMERKFPCKFCDYRFATQQKRKAHADIHTGDMKYVCFICEYQCSSENRLKAHKTSVKHLSMKEYLLTGKPLIEEEQSTSKKEKIKDTLRKKEWDVKKKKKDKRDREKKSEMETVEIACDICGDKFDSEALMLEHKQTHPFIEFPNDDKPSRIFFK